jgi:hypothetical protein
MEYTFYRIYSKNPAITECYIGSTEDFEVRKRIHKSSCNINSRDYNLKVYQYIRSNGGFEAFEFEIIDTIIFSETDRLFHERRLMDLYGSKLNTRIPIRTEEDKKEYHKKYRETHKEEIKEYYETHKEEIKEYQKEYRETHKEKRKTKMVCECGGRYTIGDISKHLKTKKHINQII